jgi:hypothetical protein
MPPRRIPATPVPEKTVQGYSPRFSKFLSDEPAPSKIFVHDHDITPAESTAISLHETRHRFNKKPPETHENRQNQALDRQNVNNVYNQALDKLGEIPEKHMQIAAECTRKVHVILGIISADPSDPVFTTSGQLLKPLEPQYANPRLEAIDDPQCYRAQWRLNQWRKEGWPDKYPAEAIRREEKEKGERLVGQGSMSTEMLRKRSQQEDGIVDFDPEEDKRRVLAKAAVKGKGKKKVKSAAAREESVSDTDEWDDVESGDDEEDDDDWS